MSAVIPSLSEQAWVTDSAKILNHLLSYYILTDNGQSLVFNSNLINLPVTYYKHINDPDGMANAVKTDLEKLLSRYFEVVDVLTEAKALSDSKYAILIYASVIDSESVKIDVSKVVEINTSGLRNVLNVVNYGNGLDILNGLT